jgi:hypothetical protein
LSSIHALRRCAIACACLAPEAIAWPPGKRKLVVLAVEGFCAEKIHEKIFTAYDEP